MEILSPAKNLETAKIAIQNGADALYFASPSFGARVNASLGLGEIREIIDYAHHYNVKCFITFNTVVFDNELENFFDEVKEVYLAGADGVILQDFALIAPIYKNFPKMEIHSSTQMHVHNSAGVLLVKELGANRVVVPREMSFARIRKIKEDTGIEIESFIHGALCVSYSGQCYDSTLLDQKSANRGRCSQYCRMPQHIYNKRTEKIISTGRYPLNLKDLNNLDNVEKYLDAGVYSLKIEGRLKQYDYVGLTTKAYKQRTERLQSVKDSEEKIFEPNDLENVYNREFTTGRINSKNGAEIVNLHKPNNTGKKIGEVVKVKQNLNREFKYYEYIISIKLYSGEIENITLQLQDNIRYLTSNYEDGQVVEKIIESNNNSVSIYSNCKPEIGAAVYRTQNAKILLEQKRLSEKFFRRRSIFLKLKVEEGRFYFQLNENEFKKDTNWISSQVVMEKPQKQPTTKESILGKLLKTHDTPYDFQITEFIYEEDQFISFSQINQLKMEILEAIKEALRIKRTVKLDSIKSLLNSIGLPNSNFLVTKERNLAELFADRLVDVFVEVRTKNQYDQVKNIHGIKILIGDYKIIELNSEKDENSKEGIKIDRQDYLVTPRIVYDDEFKEIDDLVEQYENLCVSELGALYRYKNKNIITNFTFNTTNLLSQKALLDKGVNKTILSIELNQEKLKVFGNSGSMVNIYGRVPVMIMDYCPINLNKQDDCGPCRRCHKGDYVLRDELEREFPLLYEGNARIGMYSKEPINLTDKVGELYSFGIRSFHFRLTSENEEETNKIMDVIVKNKKTESEYYRGSYYKSTL